MSTSLHTENSQTNIYINTTNYRDIYRHLQSQLHNKLTFILQRHFYYIYRKITNYRNHTTNYSDPTQECGFVQHRNVVLCNTTIYRDHPNVTLWFCATQQITVTTQTCKLPCTNYKDNRNHTTNSCK